MSQINTQNTAADGRPGSTSRAVSDRSLESLSSGESMGEGKEYRMTSATDPAAELLQLEDKLAERRDDRSVIFGQQILVVQTDTLVGVKMEAVNQATAGDLLEGLGLFADSEFVQTQDSFDLSAGLGSVTLAFSKEILLPSRGQAMLPDRAATPEQTALGVLAAAALIYGKDISGADLTRAEAVLLDFYQSAHVRCGTSPAAVFIDSSGSLSGCDAIPNDYDCHHAGLVAG